MAAGRAGESLHGAASSARGERIIEPFFDDPFSDHDTEPVMAYANDLDFAA